MIVIGAGVSGLAAAQLIQEELGKEETVKPKPKWGGFIGGNRNKAKGQTNNDPPVLVLEARDRIGGRVYTHVDDSVTPPVRIDLGATWIHGSKKSGQPIARLATKIGEKLIPDFIDDFPIYRRNGGGKIVITSEDALRAGEKRCYRSLKKAKARGREIKKSTQDNVSIKDTLEMVDPGILQDPIATLFLKLHLEFDVGGPLDTISTHFDNDEEFGGDDFIPVNGYKPLMDDLARGLDIRCSVVAQVIRYDTDGVQIETNQGTYRADRVICTVPLGVLKSGTIRFEPGLSESKREAIDRIGWGTINKVGLLFDHTFWPEGPKGFGVALEDSPYNYIINKFAFNGTSMLEAYSVGNHAVEMGRKSDQDVVDDLLNVIGTIFGRDEKFLRTTLVKPYIQRWGNEEFTRGAYSYSSLRTRERDFEAFEKSQLKVLFFAGEHANVDYRGAAHGAYLSGRWTGRQVVDTLK